MTTQVTISADVMPVKGFEIARRLEAHVQAARGALANQTCRALASDSRIWSAWCIERNVSVLPAEPTTVVGFVDAQAELKSPATGAPSGLRPSSFVMCNTPVEVQFTSAGCLNYPCRFTQSV